MAENSGEAGKGEYTIIPPRSTRCCGAAALGGCAAAVIVDQMPDRMGQHNPSLNSVERYCPAAEVYAPGTGFVQRSPAQQS